MSNRICYFVHPLAKADAFPVVPLPGYNREYKSIEVAKYDDTFKKVVGLSLYEELDVEQVVVATKALVSRTWENIMIKKGKRSGVVDRDAYDIECLSTIFLFAANHGYKTVVSPW